MSDSAERERRLAHLASFPELNPNPIVEADLSGRVRYANPAALRLFPEMRDRPDSHPWFSDWEKVTRSLREEPARTARRTVTVRGRHYLQTLFYTPEEGVIRAYGLDITERVRAEEALRASEERFRTLANAIPQLAWIAQDDGYIHWYNERWYEYTGTTPEQMAGWGWQSVHDPGALPAVLERWRESIATGRPFDMVFPIRGADGVFRPFLTRVQPLKDSKGRVVQWFGTNTDVSERMRAEVALERSRQGSSRLAAASLAVMARTDVQGMLQAVSEAALTLTGARLATCGHGFVGGQPVVGGSARAPGAPECPPGNMFQMDKGGVHMALMESAGTIRLTDGELRAHARWWGLPEEHVPMRGLLGVPMLAAGGRRNGMILVTDKEEGDFTEEDESLLERLATIASLALQQVEARISLEEADRSKSQFLAMLSHELRNPLAPIRNSLFVLERAAPGGDQARRAHGVIDRQVTHLTRLVDDLLDVTRVSRGKIQLQRERMDLCGAVRRAAEDQADAFSHAGIGLETAIPQEPVFIHGDRTRIAQVIGNLLQNATKFTPPGGRATVTVEENVSLLQAIVRVRDTGVGIAPEMLPHVFEPFAQADSTLDRSKGGLGLGLALVKGIVELHGGAVSAESEGPGRGAQITVRLPLAAAERPDAVPRGMPRDHAPRRILVIEDAVDTAESLRELLQMRGHTLEVAFEGPGGIEKARVFRPDVVLCDIGLPGMDGYEVARTMRSDPELSRARLVALTGYAAPEDVARSKEAGFDAHVAKPPKLEILYQIISGGAPG